MTASIAAVVMSSSALPSTASPMTNTASTASPHAPSPHSSSPSKSVPLNRGNQPVQQASVPTPKPPPRPQQPPQQPHQPQQQSQQPQQQPQQPQQQQASRLETLQHQPSQRQRQAEQSTALSSSQQQPSVVPPSPKASPPPNASSSASRGSTASTLPPQSSVNSPHPSKPSSNGRRGSGASDGGDSGGEIVGEYVLGDTIGKGTFGKVKLGLHLITGEKVAVKILEKKRIVQIADVERVAREIKILKRNRHTNVIQLFEVIDSPERIFLVMEHIDGGEMFEYIVAHHRLRESEAAALFRQIVDGLAYLHANEVTHRDLKPENLLLQSVAIPQPGGANFMVKIVDFGLSNTHDGGRLLRTACGSPCYAAPEMIEGKLYRGPMADVWSLGVVLFAMVCGFLPFEDSNTNLLYKKILSADYKLPPFLSPAVQDLIRRIFETDPDKRLPLDLIRQHAWVTGRAVNVMNSAPTTPRASSVPSLAHPIAASSSTVSVESGGGTSDESTSSVDTSGVLKAMVFTQLEALGVDTSGVEAALRQNAHNSLTASYYLLYNKLQRVFKDRSGAATTSTATSTAGRTATARGYSSRQVADTSSRRGDSTPRAPVQPSGIEVGAIAARSPYSQAVDGTTPSRRSSEVPVATRRVLTPQQPQQQTHSAVQQQQTRSGMAPHRPGSVRGGRHIVVASGGGTAGPMQGVGPNPPPASSSSSHSSQLAGLQVPRAPVNGGNCIATAGAHARGSAADAVTSRSHASSAMVALKPLTNAPRPELPPSTSGQRRAPDRRHTVDSGDSPAQSASASIRTPPSAAAATPAIGGAISDGLAVGGPPSGGVPSVVVTASGSTAIRPRPHAPAARAAVTTSTAPTTLSFHRPVPPDRPSTLSKPLPSDAAAPPPMVATSAVATAPSGKEDDTRVAQRFEAARVLVPGPPRRPSTRGGGDKAS